MNPDGSKNWLTLYREAVLEPDPKKSKARIVQAQRAIDLRARELWYAKSPETAERRQLETAQNFLGLLRMIADEQS